MGQKTVRFSDLSGQLFMPDDEPVRIVIQEHPDLADGPVEIEALADEAMTLEKAALRVTIADLYFPGDEEPRHVVVDVDAFAKAAVDKPVAEILAAAPPARRSARPAASPSRGDRADYGTLDHAGRPHKGKVTEAEKRLVREHFDDINKRLAAQGLRTVDLADLGHVERYGLEQLAAERGIEPR